MVSEYGLTPDQLILQMHYFGPAPGSGIVAAVTVVTATFPSGAVLTRAIWMEPFSDGGSGGVGCVDQPSPAEVPAAERITEMRCDRPQMGEQVPDDPRTLLVVLIPPGIGGSSFVADGSAGPSTIPLSDPGFAVAAFPVGAETVNVQEGGNRSYDGPSPCVLRVMRSVARTSVVPAGRWHACQAIW